MSEVYEAALQAFDISYLKALAQEQMIAVAHEWQRPSVLLRPRVYIDGSQWCALYGDDLQNGVAGFGASPDAAMRDFDQVWHRKFTPPNPDPLKPEPEGTR